MTLSLLFIYLFLLISLLIFISFIKWYKRYLKILLLTEFVKLHRNSIYTSILNDCPSVKCFIKFNVVSVTHRRKFLTEN